MSDRLLVFGGTGMMGHRLVLEAHAVVDTWWTSRESGKQASRLLPMDRQIPGVEVTDMAAVTRALRDVRPTVVINCAGTVKQRTDVSVQEMIRTNSVFPHDLADACDQIGARVIHLSTDHVFSGDVGDRPFGYSIADTADADDTYGRSKLLGEIGRAPHLTVRTSMIGPELSQHFGLLDWFRNAAEPIYGYRRALFSGFTTPTLARILMRLAFERSDLSGLHHLAGPAIDKYSLLLMLRDHFRPGVNIVPEEAMRVDRRLDGRDFADRSSISVPSWDEMLVELTALLHGYPKEP